MSVVIQQLLSLLAVIVSGLTKTSQIANVIITLQQILSLATEEIVAIAPFIRNIINGLKANAQITPAQMTALRALDAQVDAAFEQAAADAGFPITASSS